MDTALVMALIGSLFMMLVTYILPCACFLAILKAKATWYQTATCSFIIAVGVTCAMGTYSSLWDCLELLHLIMYLPYIHSREDCSIDWIIIHIIKHMYDRVDDSNFA
ncbi:hypothetical protein ZWY2020_005686 [Hordeum vulgare]|nr:hypothetical protein ZWY2020_005686 [Hordeum vulgare]